MAARATSRTNVRGRSAQEMGTLVRASISSGIATLTDGLAYQLLLFVVPGFYGVAALAGAMLGGVTNFSINRAWVFDSTTKRLRSQAMEYALASLLTYAALQSCLFVFIEMLHVDEHVAWLPAKAIAWLFVSYPVQRFLVFSKSSAAPVPDADDALPTSQHPPIAA